MSVQVGGEGKKRKDRIIRVWSSFFSLGSDPICCSFLGSYALTEHTDPLVRGKSCHFEDEKTRDRSPRV